MGGTASVATYGFPGPKTLDSGVQVTSAPGACGVHSGHS